ncbi:hypothetical protein C8J56DRAFT_1042834 [Mycena floridula]|nr:hypothetical protein C8J56DRAFT_1042834 [Mycena floridula]
MDLLTLPSLLDFSFAADDPWPQASFEAMIERSSFKLTTLGIHCKDIRTTEIDQCLQIPTLQEFRLSECAISPPRLLESETLLLELGLLSIVVYHLVFWIVWYQGARCSGKPDPIFGTFVLHGLCRCFSQYISFVYDPWTIDNLHIEVLRHIAMSF